MHAEFALWRFCSSETIRPADAAPGTRGAIRGFDERDFAVGEEFNIEDDKEVEKWYARSCFWA
jgi:hypothetical protein